MRSKLNVAFFLLVVQFIVHDYAHGQDSAFVKSTFKGDFAQYFGTRLTFPRNLAMQGITGYDEIEFRVNKFGKIDSIKVIATPHVMLSGNVIQILLSTKDKWTATVLNGNKVDFKYKLIVEYKTTPGPGEIPVDLSKRIYEKARKKQKENKFDEALSLVEKAISQNPYNPEYYKLRSDLYQSIGNSESSKRDKQLADQMEKQQLDVLTIVAYGVEK